MKSHDSRKRNVFRHSISWLSLVCITIFLLTACSYEDAKTPVRATPRSSSTQQAQPTRKAQAPVFQTGIVNPRWGSSSYGASDGEWQNSLSTIKTQTAAAWLEIPVLFSQPAEDSANIHADEGTPTVDAFISGVRQAHAQGFKVFFTPLLTVREPGGWSGLITPDPSIQQSWFDNYWNTLKPYVNAARANGVEQMALATEMEWLESHAPGTLWQQLISRVRRTYTGSLTYDMNWFTVKDPLPGWLKDSGLNYIGVSEYKPLIDTPTP